MRYLIPILMLLSLGCRSHQTITIQPDPNLPPQLVVENSNTGRACSMLEASQADDGTWLVEMRTAQDGTTDYGVGRFGAFVVDVVGSTPFVGRQSTMAEAQRPSLAESACAAFFVGDDEDDERKEIPALEIRVIEGE